MIYAIYTTEGKSNQKGNEHLTHIIFTPKQHWQQVINISTYSSFYAPV